MHPADVYGEWLDECERLNAKRRARPVAEPKRESADNSVERA